MRKAKAKHGIVQNAIFGYDSAACISLQDNSTPIEEHVGFKVLLGHFIEENPAFKPWTGGKPVLKRGRLLKAAERIGHTVQLVYFIYNFPSLSCGIIIMKYMY